MDKTGGHMNLRTLLRWRRDKDDGPTKTKQNKTNTPPPPNSHCHSNVLLLQRVK